MKKDIPFLSDIYKKYQAKFFEKFNKELDYKLVSDAYLKYKKAQIMTIPEIIEFEPVKNPEISIIIPVFNQFELTMRCLQSINERTFEKNYEIILIDDNSEDETTKIENKVKNITIIKNKSRKGYLKNCNTAAKAARGRFLHLLNNDTQIFPEAVENLKLLLDNNQNFGAAGSKLIYPNGKLQSAGSKIKPDGNTSPVGHFKNPLEAEFNNIREADFCCGASLMVKKELWEQLGGFDELFAPGYYEETDFCMRLREAGYKTLYQPFSEVIHFTGCSFKESTNRLIKENRQKFCRKWGRKLRDLDYKIRLTVEN